MAGRPKFQFCLRDLFWVVSLIGVSMGSGVAAWRLAQTDYVGVCFPLLLESFACFGAGIGWIFRQPIRGAIAALFAIPLVGSAYFMWVVATEF
jgi:hypothetical protein